MCVSRGGGGGGGVGGGGGGGDLCECGVDDVYLLWVCVPVSVSESD